MFKLKLFYLIFLIFCTFSQQSSFSQNRKEREQKVDSLIADLSSIDTVIVLAGTAQINLLEAGSMSEDAAILKGIVKYLNELKLIVKLNAISDTSSIDFSNRRVAYFKHQVKDRVFGIGPVYIPLLFDFIINKKKYPFSTKMSVYSVTDFVFESHSACKKYFFYEKGSSKPKRFQVKYF